MRITVSRTYFIKLIAESFVLFIVMMLTSSLAENNSASLCRMIENQRDKANCLLSENLYDRIMQA